MRVTLGMLGRLMPRATRAVTFAQAAERDGFDAVWWPCHWMSGSQDSGERLN